MQAHHKLYTNVGVVEGLKRIFVTEGWIGYFKGNGAQMVRIFPYAGIQFYTYEHYRKALPQLFGESEVTRFLSGSMAGVTAVCVTYPLDLVRSRLAFQGTLTILLA